MASTQAGSSASAASSSGAISPEESRPQAGPLPLKRGEIGYSQEEAEVEESENSAGALPERHPADRDAPPPASAPTNPSTSTSSTSSPLSPPTPTTTADDASSTASLKKRKRFSFLRRKKYAGLQLGTILLFSIQMIFILGTIAAWVVAGLLLSKSASRSNSSSSTSSGSDSSSSSESSSSAASSSVFVHVIFAVTFLAQCLFLERRIYVLRAQRYAFLHPGEILPFSRRRPLDATVALSPWNRPPLPTYAAALAQSGVGTGDVEDHLIAAPPPPAYGNTRGSTLLLSGFLNATLRAQRPVSARSEMSQQQDRPVSYVSRDDDWEVIQDADRAMQLETTLARLERPGSRQTSR